MLCELCHTEVTDFKGLAGYNCLCGYGVRSDYMRAFVKAHGRFNTAAAGFRYQVLIPLWWKIHDKITDWLYKEFDGD